MSTASTATNQAAQQERPAMAPATPITMGRLVKVELRKMFDTRSGFWLMTSIVALSLIAAVAVMLFSRAGEITFGSFGAAVGIPLGILLPVMAILVVTAEWSQRTGLVTFTLMPKRGRVLAAKAVVGLGVAALSVLVAMAIGAVINVLSSVVRGHDMVWDVSALELLYLVLGNVLGVAVGYVFALLIRNSPGAIVAYVAWAFVLPGIFFALASNQQWFADLQPWIDLNYASQYLYAAQMSAEHWAQIGTSAVLWLGLPLVIALFTLRKAEVK